MSEIYIFECRVCHRNFKRYAHQVYDGAEGVCTKCNKEIPFDGEDKPREQDFGFTRDVERQNRGKDWCKV